MRSRLGIRQVAHRPDGSQVKHRPDGSRPLAPVSEADCGRPRGKQAQKELAGLLFACPSLLNAMAEKSRDTYGSACKHGGWFRIQA
mmetsp:Transcript_6608/g.18611  ORF Transcript_6608/g.18611 Transcript_6608/m.18611 type:complete len:86 (+) Transcript_6608:401-658(+)